MPEVSIIIPVYNVAPYLIKCLRSVQTITEFSWEALLIDDGSIDQSAAICDEFSIRDSRLRIFHLPNSGVSAARNFGLNHACGKWIVFVDADDFLFEKAGEMLAEAINNASGADLIHWGWGYKDNAMLQFNSVTLNNEILDIKQICRRNIFHGYVWTYAFCRHLIEKHGLRFSTDLKYAEDWEFILRYYSLSKNVYLFKGNLYCQVKRDGSATNRKLGKCYITDNFRMFSRILDLAAKQPIYYRILVYSAFKSIIKWFVFHVLYFEKDKYLWEHYHQCLKTIRHTSLGCFVIMYAPMYVTPPIYTLLCRIERRISALCWRKC